MNIKDLKLIIADLDDNIEVTKELLLSLITKPIWTQGETLYVEWKDTESFDEAWKRITNSKLTDTVQNSCVAKWTDRNIFYYKMGNGFVIVTTLTHWSIQLDPTTNTSNPPFELGLLDGSSENSRYNNPFDFYSETDSCQQYNKGFNQGEKSKT
jgi:hypothetical protein